MANYNLIQAIEEYNLDQVRTQTMYEIDFVSGIDTIDQYLTRMQVYGNNFTLPDRTVNFEDLQYRAYKIPVPTTLDMGQDHSVTVYADVRGDLRKAMLDWQALCINPDIRGGMGEGGGERRGDDSHHPGSYFQSNRRPTKVGEEDGKVPTITIKLLAPDYFTVIETTYIYGARVTKVGGLELSNTSGSISTFTVDFKSVYWEQALPEFGESGNTIAPNNRDGFRNWELGETAEEFDGRATNDNTPA